MPLNVSKKKKAVGLDLGHSHIKIVEIEQTQLGWRMINAINVPTPAGTISDCTVIEPTQLAAFLKALLKQHKISATACHISVSSSTVIVRTVKMPKMSEDALRKSIRFEAGRYIPNTVDDCYVEFEILGDAPEGQMSVLIVAAPRELVDSRIQACTLAGMTVETVDIEPFAAYRSLIEFDNLRGWDEETFGFVDIGSHVTKVNIISHGQFLLSRTIMQGGRNLTDNLAHFFKIDQSDAENGKRQLNVSELISELPIDNPPLKVIQPNLEEMVRELKRTFNYVQASGNEANLPPVTKMVLCGGGSQLKGFANYLSAKLDMEVVALGILDNPRFSYLGTEDIGSGMDLAVAAGLAMREAQAA